MAHEIDLLRKLLFCTVHVINIKSKNLCSFYGETMQKKSFSTRLSLYITFTITCTFLSVFIYNYLQTERTLQKMSLDQANTLAMATTEKIERILQRVEQIPRYIAYRLTTEDFTTEELKKILVNFVESQPDIYGATIAFAHKALPNAPERYAPYYHKKDGKLHQSNLADDKYEYWLQDWYTLPKEAGKPLWGEPYYDQGGGNTSMTTFSVPVYKQDAEGKKTFFAIVTADISIQWLQKIMADIKVYKTGSAFLLSRNGIFIAQHNNTFTIKFANSIYDVAKAYNAPKLEELAKKMTSGQKGIASLINIETKENVEVIYNPLPSSGWSLALYVPVEELLSELHTQTLIAAFFAFIGIAVTVILVSIVAYGATKPLRQLSKSTEEIATGKLDSQLPKIKHFDEIGQLTLAFEHMRTDLKRYIDNLTTATAAKERIESELKIARTIQESFVPKNFPPFPERTEFDIFASLLPAREVGGDFYDFFIFDEDLLFFSVGDVSGKGVPAALFMAVTKTLVKGIAEHERDPAKVLQFVNDELAEENDSCMFVTLFCGIFNIRTGELTYTNAGHDAPLIVRKDEAIAPLALTKSVALGVMEGINYTNSQIQLLPEDMLLLYTDGVTEAMSPTQKQFGLHRLYTVLEGNNTVNSLVTKVSQAVKEHAGDAEQSDDITIMALQWTPLPISRA